MPETDINFTQMLAETFNAVDSVDTTVDFWAINSAAVSFFVVIIIFAMLFFGFIFYIRHLIRNQAPK